MAETMILTHIYLLMGCGFPLAASYILLSGGIFPSEWVIWSLSGVIVLGVGDSAAAILGKWHGTTRWRELSAKTQEGSSYLVVATAATYYFCISVIDPNGNYLFLCYIMAAIAAAVVEGRTYQYDNLVLSMFFFSVVIFFVTIFADEHGHY